jgi:hypothetical protein
MVATARAKQCKEDPFGDEENAEAKSRTMKWWQASMGACMRLDVA